MAEQKCLGNHAVHICELAKNGKFEEIKKIAKEPEFMCMNCGRLADKKENLCNPLAVEQIGLSGI
jgi:hypothetical protein